MSKSGSGDDMSLSSFSISDQNILIYQLLIGKTGHRNASLYTNKNQSPESKTRGADNKANWNLSRGVNDKCSKLCRNLHIFIFTVSWFANRNYTIIFELSRHQALFRVLLSRPSLIRLTGL